ncbi:MAG: CidA/LrgA family protein [Thiotrichaceae bacterium]|nr:CidA/LrgA family protein [Thiotrichaceae bacterium]
MLLGISILLICQLCGEVLVRLLNFPVPGPVVGMVLLLIVLIIKGSVPKSVQTVGDALLNNIALLYVPAGVGLMEHFKLISKGWLVISIALVVSTIVTMAVTAIVLKFLTEHHVDKEKPYD